MMNKARLQHIFANYINKFESFNQPAPKKPNETFKWEIAYDFHDLMNPERSDFAQSIRIARKNCGDLIDSSNRYPFFALEKCAQCSDKDAHAVQAIFRALFADDGGDLSVRQRKIEQFIDDANALIARCHSTNGIFMNDQRSAMAYLALYDPDNHYLYKATEANSFASCIRFFDDWGSGTNFHLDVYYRMCDALVQEIRNCEPLIKTHKSRYAGKNGLHLHPDTNYHILAFDIIYGAPENRYNFYEGIPFSMITPEERVLYQERVKKVQELTATLEAEQNTMNLLTEAKSYFRSVLTPGTEVKSSSFGVGQIVAFQEIDLRSYLKIKFAETGEEKPYMVQSFVNGQLSANVPDMPEKLAQYKPVFAINEKNLRNKIAERKAERETYQMLLEKMSLDEA